MQELEILLKEGRELSPAQVREAAAFLIDPQPAAERKAALLRALSEKGESPAEIAGFVEEFLRHAVEPGIDQGVMPGPVLDVVGTGGDKLNLFNVSTTAMFILASGGVCVVKHGNRGITGNSGAADVLEALGVKIDPTPEKLERCVREVGIGFIFAPLYHPAFKAVAEARKLLAAEGQRSIFNLIGPLLNPARPPHQLVGVYDKSLVPVFADILRRLGRKSAWVVHGETEDGRGMDELSTIGKNTIAQLVDGSITAASLEGTALGFHPAKTGDLVGGDAQHNANILEGILARRIQGPKRDLAVLNAAAGFIITGKAGDIANGKAFAEDLLDRGAAHGKLRKLIDWC